MFGKPKHEPELTTKPEEPDYEALIQGQKNRFANELNAARQMLKTPSNPFRVVRVEPEEPCYGSAKTVAKPGGWVVQHWRVEDLGAWRDTALSFSPKDRLELAQERKPALLVTWTDLSPRLRSVKEAEAWLHRWLNPNFDAIEYDEHGKRVQQTSTSSPG